LSLLIGGQLPDQAPTNSRKTRQPLIRGTSTPTTADCVLKHWSYGGRRRCCFFSVLTPAFSASSLPQLHQPRGAVNAPITSRCGRLSTKRRYAFQVVAGNGATCRRRWHPAELMTSLRCYMFTVFSVRAAAAGSLLHVVGIVGRSRGWLPLHLCIVFSASILRPFSDYSQPLCYSMHATNIGEPIIERFVHSGCPSVLLPPHNSTRNSAVAVLADRTTYSSYIPLSGISVVCMSIYKFKVLN